MKAKTSFWTAEEMDLSKDLCDLNNHLNDNEYHFIPHVLMHFAASDGIVNENLVKQFSNKVQALRLVVSMVSRSWWETSPLRRTCSWLTYIKDFVEHEYLFNVMDTLLCVKRSIRLLKNKSESSQPEEWDQQGLMSVQIYDLLFVLTMVMNSSLDKDSWSTIFQLVYHLEWLKKLSQCLHVFH